MPETAEQRAKRNERVRASRARTIKDVFTTGQVAKICRVAPRTVAKWADAGKLKCHRIPMSLDRRIPREGLIAFLLANNMPLRELADEAYKVLFIAADPVLSARMGEQLPAADGFDCRSAADLLAAGILLPTYRPAVVVVDSSLGRSVACSVAAQVRAWAAGLEIECPLLVALAGEDDDPAALKACGFDDVYQKPVDVAALADRIRTVAAG